MSEIDGPDLRMTRQLREFGLSAVEQEVGGACVIFADWIPSGWKGGVA
jgi:hypothetical protein